MIKLTSFRLFAFFALLIGMIACNKKDSVPNNGKAALYSFGPTGSKIGDTLRFVGVNLDKVTSIQFTGPNATVDKANFKLQSSELIRVIVPTTAEKGYVILKTSDGDTIRTKTQLNLNVLSTVTSFTAQARPGDNITISGTYLNWVNHVTFARDKAVANFVSRSQTQIVVKVPDDAQTGPLVLHYSGTDSADIQTADTLKVTLPVATSFSPNPVKHAANVTITGTDLDLARKVIFNGVSTPVTSFVSQSATQLVVKVPGATTKGKVKLEAASGVQTTSSADLDVVLPSITSFTPNPIDTATNLTITGTNLDLVNGIAFVGPPSAVTSFVSQSPTQIVVRVPKGTLKGKITLNVLNSTLTVQSNDVLIINGGLPSLPDFTMPIYTDAGQNGFQDWSYTDSHDFNNTENVRQGTKAIKAVYGGNTYQAITFHTGTAISTTGYTSLEFSVFAPISLNGKKLQVITNGNYGGSVPQVTLVGGEWATFSVPLSSMGSPATIGEIVLQSAGFTGTVYIDHVGLR